MSDLPSGTSKMLLPKRWQYSYLAFLTTTLETGRILAGSNPMRWAQKRKAPVAGSLTKQVVGDEGCRVRLAPPAFAAALRSSRAALENACAFPQLRTLAGSNPSAMGSKRKAPIAGGLIIQVVGDEGCRVRLAPPAFASSLRSSRAALENACAFPQLRTLAGSNPMHWAQKRKAPVAGSLSKQVVGDEGFEPPALCV